MAQAENLREQLINFAVQAVKFSSFFPKDDIGKHTANQILKFGTSPATYYSVISGKEDVTDLSVKLESVLNELNQMRTWFEIIKRSEILQLTITQQIASECAELCKIMNSRIAATKKKQPRENKSNKEEAEIVAEEKEDDANGKLESSS